MSNVTIVQTYNQIFIGSDSAVSSTINDQDFRVSEDGKKLFVIDEKIIFCSGVLSLSYDIMNEYQVKVDRSIESLQDIAKKKYNQYINKNNRNNHSLILDIIVSTVINNRSIIYQISPYNEFKIIEMTVENEQEIGVWTGGIKTQESFDLTCKYISLDMSITNVFKNVFNDISYESIGGNLTLYHIEQNKLNKLVYEPIKEKSNLRRVEDLFNQCNIKRHLIVGERIFGKIIAGTNLTIENDAGKFILDNNGASFEGDSFTIDQGGNGISLSPVNGIEITRNDDLVKSTFNATDGIKIEVKDGSSWRNSLYFDVDTSNLMIDGEINARAMKVNGVDVLTEDGSMINGEYISINNTTLDSEIGQIKQQFSVMEGELTSLIEQDIEALDGRITSNTTLINQTATAIRGEVSAIETNINGQLENKASITLLNNELELKVSTTDYTGDTIASLITAKSSAINLISENINLSGKVTFSSFNSTLQSEFNSKTTEDDVVSIVEGTITAPYVTVGNTLRVGQSGTATKNIEFRGGQAINATSSYLTLTSPNISLADGNVWIGTNGYTTHFDGEVDFSGAITNLVARFA